jgi:hypothetical protein
VGLFHLEVWNTVAKQTTDAVIALVYGNGVAGTGKLLSRCETRRTRTNYGDGLAGHALWSVRSNPTLVEGLINNRDFNFLDGHCWLVDTEHTGRLTRSWAEATGELREVVGLVKTLNGGLTLVAPG